MNRLTDLVSGCFGIKSPFKKEKGPSKQLLRCRLVSISDKEATVPPVPNSLSALDPETVCPLPRSEVIVHFNRSDFLCARLGGVGVGGRLLAALCSWESIV